MGFSFGADRTPHDSKHLNRWRGLNRPVSYNRVIPLAHTPAFRSEPVSEGLGQYERQEVVTNSRMNGIATFGTPSDLSVGIVRQG